MAKVPLTSGADILPTAETQSREAAETTGRYIVTFREGADPQAATAALSNFGLRTATAADFRESAVDFQTLGAADSVVLPEIGVAVVSAEPDQMASMSAADEASPILAVEPERYVYALSAPAPVRLEEPEVQEAAPRIDLSPAAAAYVRGYRDALDSFTSSLLSSAGAEASAAAIAPTAFVETNFTWGLQATRVHLSPLSGRGIRVAVLDTGMDLQHPDFAGRSITAASFVPGQAPQDGHGHGTHCIGTSCGPRTPGVRPRYGIAYEAAIFVGKVLNNAGSGTDGWILAGINWAVANGCPVISMSLGRPVNPGEPPPVAYETAARNALNRRCLIVAAAGNDSNRSAGVIRPVSAPANCPSIMAVGAIDENFRIANFSNRAINGGGGEVNLVGPGVRVRSSWPMPTRYNTISGTSMATPHVAGIAALYAQTSPLLRGAQLWLRLLNTARNIVTIPPVDDGRGLVQII
ncbi:MAG TPA: S8 family serine peptidase [Bryobacteraceae bacterium]|nr:S8 family serine peptidase [Bryobacteraceae bacterium]